jgi:hypothetical protein
MCAVQGEQVVNGEDCRGDVDNKKHEHGDVEPRPLEDRPPVLHGQADHDPSQDVSERMAEKGLTDAKGDIGGVVKNDRDQRQLRAHERDAQQPQARSVKVPCPRG